MKLENFTIKTARQGLIKKKFTCVELTQAYLDKVKKENKKYNDFLLITDKLALDQAKKVDEKISRKQKLGPIEGIPIAVKDNMLVENYITTAGSKILENYIAPYDATVVKKLKNAGAVILGKTNLDEFAMGASTENSGFGVVKNPHDTKLVPGGSSGGSTAAVAANHCVVALGSDTGGSIRQPASFCGVNGFKPSYGMVSRYGLMAMASSLDQIGTIAKTVEDAKLVFNVIKGKDKLDSTTIQNSRFANAGTKFKIDSKFKIQNSVIGVPKEYFGKGLDRNVKKEIEKAIEKFKKLGFKIKNISLPHTDPALAVYYIIMPAEVSANLARYDSIKYGLSIKGKDLLDQYLKTRAIGFGEEVRRRIMLGTYVLSAGYKDAYYNKAQKVRVLIKQDFENAFNPPAGEAGQVDIILTPTAPTTAFKIGEKQDPLSMYLSDVYTIQANLAGLPGISIPVQGVKGLPIGLQLIGPQFKDDLVLEIAQAYE